MNSHKETSQRGHFAEERGAALPFVAVMMVLLIGMAAFAVDLGWLYLNGSRVQRGADAAALAGVVHLPANTAQVTAQSVNGANANGWDVGEVNGTAIVGGGPDILNWQPLSENRLEVQVTSRVPTFFMKIFGIRHVDMTRTATAEYVKPVPMGSPSACFGIAAFAANLTGTQSLANQGLGHCASWEMNFWAAINGPLTAKEHGDPYAVRCLRATSTGCQAAPWGANPDYRPSGYYYGIEIPDGKTSFDVKIFDAAFYARGCQVETGDCQGLTHSASGGMTTHFTVYHPDGTPLDPTDNTSTVCPTSSFATDHLPTTRNVWTTVCTLTNAGGIPPGIYVLNVRSTGDSGGNNSYSVGVTTSPNTAPHARVYAINDMSIFTNSGGAAVATVYLAEVAEIHAGKNLQLDFYDPGENPSGDAWVEVRTPTNGAAACRWSSRNEAGAITGGPASINPCRLQSTVAGVAQFNAQWLNTSIDIPNSYTCGATCFWTMRLELGLTSQDRTTWAARVIGNPVRLVPNQP
jgi:Flp pilus assembly protein TadG